MKKFTTEPKNTETPKETLYDGLTFFTLLLDRTLQNPNEENAKELQEFTEHLPFSDEFNGPK